MVFVNACAILCQKVITKTQITQAHDLLKIFCQKFEEVYGWEACVPNMHMSLHLKKCLEDYGPTFGFWCFSFERFNGTLGKFQTNNHSITVQLMRKFLGKNNSNIDDDIKNYVNKFFPKIFPIFSYSGESSNIIATVPEFLLRIV